MGIGSAVAVLTLSPLAGYAADHLPRKRILYVTNVFQAAMALALGILVQLHALVFWELLVLTALRAANQAFDAPARQSWISVLVPRQYVGNAIGAMALSFNGPSVIGPPIAGFLIAWTGVATSFYINAAATLVAVASLAAVTSSPPGRPAREGVLAALRGGFAFLARHPILRDVVLMMIAVALLLRPYVQQMPAYAAHVVSVDARGLGILLGASGIGGFLGALATAIVGNVRRGLVWLASIAIFALTIVALGLVHTIAAAIPLLLVAGFSVLSFQTSSMVMLQLLAPDEMRGRAVAASSMITLGFIPAGALVVGTIAAATTLSTAYLAVGAFVLVLVTAVGMRNAALRSA